MAAAAIIAAVLPVINQGLSIIGSKQQFNYQQGTVNADAYWNWGPGEYTEDNTSNTTGIAVALGIVVILIVAFALFRKRKKIKK